MRYERLNTRRSKGSILRKNTSSLNKEVNQFRKKQNILWGCTKLTAHTAKGVQCSDTQDVRNELKGQESVTKKAISMCAERRAPKSCGLEKERVEGDEVNKRSAPHSLTPTSPGQCYSVTW